MEGNSLLDRDTTSEEQFHIPGYGNLFWGAIAQWTSMGISIVLGLTITPVIIRTLGKAPYGLWGLAASFVGFYGLFDFGLGSAISRFLGNALGARDLQAFNRVAATGRYLLSSMAGLLVIAAFLGMAPAQSILRIPEEYAGQFRALVLLCTASTALSMIMAVYDGALLASEDFIFLNGIRIGSSILRAAGSLTAVLSGTGVVGLATVNVFATILEEATVFWRCRVRLPQMRTSLSQFHLSVARALFGFASVTFIVIMADTLRSKLDVMMVTRFCGLTQAGIYSVGLSAFMCFFRGTAIVAGIGRPRLNRLAGSNDIGELRTFFVRISHLTAAVACLMSGTLIGLAALLIRLWVGPGYETSALVVQILTMGFCLDIATNPGIGSLFATARHKYFAGQTVFEALISFAMAYILGSRIGILGVPLGMVSSLLITKITIQPWYVCRTLGISLREYWARNIASTWLGMSVLAGGLILAQRLLHQGHVAAALPIIACTVIVTHCIAWWLILDTADRALLRSKVAAAINRLARWRKRHIITQQIEG